MSPFQTNMGLNLKFITEYYPLRYIKPNHKISLELRVKKKPSHYPEKSFFDS